MATENPGLVKTYAALADLSAKRYYIVNIEGVKSINLAAAGETAIGVLQNEPELGQAGSVMLDGVTKVVLGGSVGYGDFLSADANGAAVKSTTGDYVILKAEDSGVSGEIISAVIHMIGKYDGAAT